MNTKKILIWSAVILVGLFAAIQINFSDWAGYSSTRQRGLLRASCRDASSGKMPGSAYTRLRPEAKLSTGDVEMLCAASREPTAQGTEIGQ